MFQTHPVTALFHAFLTGHSSIKIIFLLLGMHDIAALISVSAEIGHLLEYFLDNMLLKSVTSLVQPIFTSASSLSSVYLSPNIIILVHFPFIKTQIFLNRSSNHIYYISFIYVLLFVVLFFFFLGFILYFIIRVLGCHERHLQIKIHYYCYCDYYYKKQQPMWIPQYFQTLS